MTEPLLKPWSSSPPHGGHDSIIRAGTIGQIVELIGLINPMRIIAVLLTCGLVSAELLRFCIRFFVCLMYREVVRIYLIFFEMFMLDYGCRMC